MAILSRSITDKVAWEQFLFSTSPQALFQSWEWGNIQQQLGASIWRIGWYSGSSVLAIAQVVKVKAKRGTYLHVRHGPLITEGHDEVVASLVKLAKSENAWFLRISPLVPASDSQENRWTALGFRTAPVHEVDAMRCWVLDITGSEELLLSNMRKSTRYDIRHAQSHGVTIIQSRDPRDLHLFLDLYEETSKRQGFVPHKGIGEEFEEFVKNDHAALFLGQLESKVVAGALVLFYGNQAIYHHGASRYQKVPVSAAVQWAAIQEAKRRGLPFYNFWGVAPEGVTKHPWSGITPFKKGFGGKEVVYLSAMDKPIDLRYAMSYTIDTLQKRMKGYN